jgi:GT2 family glycosyltransferase
MKLIAQFTCIGKHVTFEAIESFTRQIPKGIDVLTIAHILKTPEVTNDYITRINSFVDNITLTTINYCGHSMILPMLFYEYDWFLDLADDCVFHDGAVEKYLDIVRHDKKAGAIGGCSDPKKPIEKDIVKNNNEFYPDLGMWFSGPAIQEVGAFCPQFTPYGYQTIELQYRMRKNKWNIYLLKDVFDHTKEAHTGRDNIRNFVQMHEVNEGLLIQKIKDLNTNKPNYWWKNRIKY